MYLNPLPMIAFLKPRHNYLENASIKSVWTIVRKKSKLPLTEINHAKKINDETPNSPLEIANT